MVLVAFNKDYRDKELGREVKANEAVEMTVKRADELVGVIQAQAKKFPAYQDFSYVRVEEDAKEDQAKAAEGEKENKKDVKEEK